MSKAVAERSDVIPALGEIFRECGFAGASLSEITVRTGLGKGSLYHFFPKGKAEMAEAVLDEIDLWFEENVYRPLRENKDSIAGIESMFDEVHRYFDSGNRICLVGAFALDNTRDQFSERVHSYFKAWIQALSKALKQCGFAQNEAKIVAEDVVGGIQGALVLARSQNDPKIFTRILKRLKNRIMDKIDD
jgi:TetR/AcrR family transcriptional repressor of lmrAB and yxaGH operons